MGGIYCCCFFLACREVSPITPLLSGVFVRRVFARILIGFQGVVERSRFLWFDKVEYFINLQWRRILKRKWRFGGSLKNMHPYGAKEWNVNWINKTGGAVIKVSCSSNIVQVWCFIQH